MTRFLSRCIVGGALVALAAGGSNSWAIGKVKAGETRPYFATTPRPYPVGSDSRPVVWTDTIRSPGATWLRLHFTRFDLAPGDYVSIQGSGGETHRYTGRGPHDSGDFWSFSTDGDRAVVRLHAGKGIGGGYTITEIGHGTLIAEEPVLEVVCGTDGRKDVACYSSPAPTTFRPIARLLFQDDSDGAFYVCTGSLVAGSSASTLITNNHCIDSQSETNSLQARFNYQKAACKGNQQAAASNYNGGSFLRTSTVNYTGGNSGLDYTLLTLQGSPEATWGEFTATTLEPGPGSLMLFPQHPAGGLKKLGKFEDRQQNVLCDVTAIHETYVVDSFGNTTNPASQFSYGCDSEGGSSGSPILNGGASRVWGLHHFGGVNNCNNSATHMSDICGDAGALLSCASN